VIICFVATRRTLKKLLLIVLFLIPKKPSVFNL